MRRVGLVDLDLQSGDCALTLNLKPTGSLREALLNSHRVDGVFVQRLDRDSRAGRRQR